MQQCPLQCLRVPRLFLHPYSPVDSPCSSSHHLEFRWRLLGLFLRTGCLSRHQLHLDQSQTSRIVIRCLPAHFAQITVPQFLVTLWAALTQHQQECHVSAALPPPPSPPSLKHHMAVVNLLTDGSSSLLIPAASHNLWFSGFLLGWPAAGDLLLCRSVLAEITYFWKP